MTKLKDNHTLKAGYFYFWSIQSRSIGPFLGSLNFANDSSGANTFDTGFGFANAAIGTFTTYQQASRLPEGGHIGINHEWFVQDTWKARANLTLDASCSFTLSAASAKVIELSTANSFNVLADTGCAWTAVPSDAWITVNSGGSGSGDGGGGFQCCWTNVHVKVTVK